MKQRFLIVLVCLLCLPVPSASSATVAQNSPPASPDGQRYLFIMDLSEDMETLKAVNETTLYVLSMFRRE